VRCTIAIIVSAPYTRTAAWTPTGRQSLLGLLGAALGRGVRNLRRAGILTAAVLRRAVRLVLLVAGLAFLDVAAYGWNHLAGYAAIGFSLLILEAVVKSTGRAP
jgi:hypothetical protein